MIKFEVTYKGKISSSFDTSLMKALVDGTKVTVYNKLKPFQKEIAVSGGRVILHVQDGLKDCRVELMNMPPELVDRINDAL